MLSRWTTIYPIYFDAKRAYSGSERRIAREKSLWWPLSTDIVDACGRLGLQTLHEVRPAGSVIHSKNLHVILLSSPGSSILVIGRILVVSKYVSRLTIDSRIHRSRVVRVILPLFGSNHVFKHFLTHHLRTQKNSFSRLLHSSCNNNTLTKSPGRRLTMTQRHSLLVLHLFRERTPILRPTRKTRPKRAFVLRLLQYAQQSPGCHSLQLVHCACRSSALPKRRTYS